MVVAVIPAAYDALSSIVNVLVARRTVQYVRCCRAIRRCGIVRLTAERDWKDTSCSQAWPAASQHGALAMAVQLSICFALQVCVASHPRST